jgi:Domain of unknown function (DUF397)
MPLPDLMNARWVKSSHSGDGACVEIAHGTTWIKSSYSENGADCVEVAQGPDWTALRDSKRPESAPLVLPRSVMEEFLAGVKAGEFDG